MKPLSGIINENRQIFGILLFIYDNFLKELKGRIYDINNINLLFYSNNNNTNKQTIVLFK